MSKILEVLNRKSVELKSEVVELGSGIDQMIGATKGVNNFSRNIEISLKELEDAKLSLKVDKKDLASEMKTLVQIVDKLEFKAKELGIKPSEIKGYKEAKSAIKKGIDVGLKVQKI